MKNPTTPSGAGTLPSGQVPAPLRRRGLRGWARAHPRVMTLLIVGIYLLITGFAVRETVADLGATAVWIFVLGCLIAAALLLRLRAPLWVTAAVTLGETLQTLIYPWYSPQLLGLWFALYAVGRSRGLLRGLVIAVGTSLVAVSPMLRAHSWSTVHGGPAQQERFAIEAGAGGGDMTVVLIQTVLVLVAFSCVSAALGAAVRRGREHEQEVMQWAEHSRELAQIGERNRIAREMHDVVAHSLSVMISLADGARVVARRDPERASEVMGEVSSTGRTALGDMRRVIGVLRAGDDVEEARRPVQGSLEELFAGFRQAGLPLAVTTKGPPLPQDQAFVLTVHRILQEALTNVLRYGKQVSEVQVTIEHVPGPSAAERERLSSDGLSAADQRALGMAPSGQLMLTIADDGLLGETPAPSVGSGQGIRGMGERAAFYNGSVYAGPGARRGWMVHAVLEPPEGGGGVVG
ncbi:sensor histidine kinase [Nesterenkonia aerolata]|uniref:histidine kinase n=1 Tax=Nesterenkonia aerolata TaxID=3074079 RepID=A0ABU2DT85_9MICC|nr:histidine kinase [Nesterenkonia sp. LY-0111]MDR8019714.1 histidine kinase [Nesterenkonia sp. LY-0111]